MPFSDLSGPDASHGRRERLFAAASLLGIAALAWGYLWIDAGRMQAVSGGMGSMTGMPPSPWQAGKLALTFLMWTVMMVGMMLPSAAPAILLYGSMVGANRSRGSPLASTWTFAAGYLAVWTAFSLAAALLQAALEAGGLLTPMMASSASPWLTGSLLVVAGLYQFLPFKDACLRKCRAPLQFFMFHWRSGPIGAFRMGAEHGLFCIGCCWALMLLLFTAGVMNLLWVALIAGYVLVEKLLARGRLIGRLAGAGLVAAGLAVLLG